MWASYFLHNIACEELNMRVYEWTGIYHYHRIIHDDYENILTEDFYKFRGNLSKNNELKEG